MNTRAGLLLLLVIVAAAVSSQASSTVGGPGPTAPYAVILDSAEGYPPAPAEAMVAAASSTNARASSEDGSDGTASVLMLFAFLGLIGANLFRWSHDGSCKSERSVF